MVVCKSSINGQSILHYYNSLRSPLLISESEPSLGINNCRITCEQNTFICCFSRDNNIKRNNYFDLTKEIPYFMVAFGKNAFTSPTTGKKLMIYTYYIYIYTIFKTILDVISGHQINGTRISDNKVNVLNIPYNNSNRLIFSNKFIVFSLITLLIINFAK